MVGAEHRRTQSAMCTRAAQGIMTSCEDCQHRRSAVGRSTVLRQLLMSDSKSRALHELTHLCKALRSFVQWRDQRSQTSTS